MLLSSNQYFVILHLSFELKYKATKNYSTKKIRKIVKIIELLDFHIEYILASDTDRSVIESKAASIYDIKRLAS